MGIWNLGRADPRPPAGLSTPLRRARPKRLGGQSDVEPRSLCLAPYPSPRLVERVGGGGPTALGLKARSSTELPDEDKCGVWRESPGGVQKEPSCPRWESGSGGVPSPLIGPRVARRLFALAGELWPTAQPVHTIGVGPAGN